MSSIKQHFFLILPLVALLFSLESFFLVGRAVISREDKLLQNYSIVIASKQKLTLAFVAQNIAEASSLDMIDTNFILEKMRLNISKEDFEKIKKSLSFYYTLKLSSFPNEKRLAQIVSTLSKVPGIIKVESFSKTHNQASKLLFLLKFSVQVFAILLGILSVLLMIGQIRIWHFEHGRRMDIMGYLGASAWMKNKFLIKAAISDSFIATLIVVVGILYFKETSLATNIFDALGVQNDVFYLVLDSGILLVTSLVVSLLSALIAIFLQRKVR